MSLNVSTSSPKKRKLAFQDPYLSRTMVPGLILNRLILNLRNLNPGDLLRMTSNARAYPE